MLNIDVWFFDQTMQSVSWLPHPLTSNGIFVAYLAVVCVSVPFSVKIGQICKDIGIINTTIFVGDGSKTLHCLV